MTEGQTITAAQFVKTVLRSLPSPYSTNIVDQVFQAIEANPEWLRIYHDLAQAHGLYQTKNSIGLNVEAITGMTVRGAVRPARSSLIENYTELSLPTI